VIAICCTKKLLARIGTPGPVIEPTTTVLGDWYAQPLNISHQRLILLIAERSRLPVIMPAREVKHLARNFPEALARVLFGLGIDAATAQREVEATREAVIAATDNRSLLGTLSDFTHMLQWQLSGRPEVDLVVVALELSHTPVGPLRPSHFPDRVTRDLLAAVDEDDG
jgi:hypothetical protein